MLGTGGWGSTRFGDGARCLRGLVLAALITAPWSAGAQPPRRGFDVLHYDARVQPDLEARAVRGTVTIRLRAVAETLSSVTFDRGAQAIDEVRVAGVAARVETPDGRLVVHLARVVKRDETVVVAVTYHGVPPHGLVFQPPRRQVYAIFSTRQWLVSVDEPDDKATLDLRIVVPPDLNVVASGAPVGQPVSVDGGTEHHWRATQPIPTFTMAFAAGRFTAATARAGETTLRFFGDGFSAEALRRIFADGADMLAFFAARAGVPYPGPTYTQVLVAETVGQEAAGFSMLSEGYGRRLLADPSAVTLAAHELAHQWWGVLVTCEDWRHFWLNEGLATFMAAAYVEHRVGRDAYERMVSGWRAILERIRREGSDKPLVFPDWNRPSANDRTLVYEKGALVLHLLREELGETAFWDALRWYTRTSAGGVTTTRDFQHRFEESAGRSLAAFFDRWVDGPRPAD